MKGLESRKRLKNEQKIEVQGEYQRQGRKRYSTVL